MERNKARTRRMIYSQNSARITFRSAVTASTNVELNFSFGDKLETSTMKINSLVMREALLLTTSANNFYCKWSGIHFGRSGDSSLGLIKVEELRGNQPKNYLS